MGGRQVHLAAHFPGVNSTTVWNRPDSGSQIDLRSFVHVARTAERGLFDFFFLAEGLRLREHRGEIFDLDVVGRPDSLTVLAALAGVTEHIGLAATLNTTFNEPYELARLLSTLDHISDGRAAWNAVTSPDAFTGENFRRGGFLAREDRYERAAAVIEAAKAVWDSWTADAVSADAASGAFVRPGSIGVLDHSSPFVEVRGRAAVPRSPQRWPVQIQAGDSDGGRELAARRAEVIFSRHSTFGAGRRFYDDVKARLGRYGREPDDLKIIPAATVVLGSSEADARDRARALALDQVSPQGAIAFVEQIWGVDLSDHDPDGPLPDFDPDPVAVDGVTRGRVRHDDPAAVAARWRARAREGGLSIRELVIDQTSRPAFVGTASQVAEKMDHHVQERAADGFILIPRLTPHGLDEVVDQVVPELQARGVYRRAYEFPTLRQNLGLPALD